MVVVIIYGLRVAFRETKRHPPVAADLDGPGPLSVTAELVERKPR
jgi:hypothetical protein